MVCSCFYQMAGCTVIFCLFDQFRGNINTVLDKSSFSFSLGTAWMKGTPRWCIDWIRHITGQYDPLRFLLRIRNRNCRQQCLGIGMGRPIEDVIDRCAKDRPGQDGTWITHEMREAYRRLYYTGWAHSVEIWQDEQLAGGLYGLAIDQVFFGESMFSEISGGSKAALLALCFTMLERNFHLLDCQIESPHLISMGADVIPRERFANELRKFCKLRKKRFNHPVGRIKIKHFRG